MRFEVGQTVVRRCVHRDRRIAGVECGRVVSDDDRGLMLWIGVGSAVVRRTTAGGEPVRKMPLARRFSIPTFLTPTAWHGGGVLVLTPPGVAHSVWWFFEPDGGFRGWYINLESPAVRWPGGLDLQDQALDVWIHPDRSWRWKDEDEFAERTGHPNFWTEQEAPAIWAEGKRMIAVAERGAYPFDGTWVDFRPDPQWTPSALPARWDLPRACDT